MAIGEVGRDLDPAAPSRSHGDRLLVQLLGHYLVDQADVLQPAAVVALEQVVQHRPTDLDVGVDADERSPLVGGAHGTFASMRRMA